jgi:hypothetical protein
MRHLIRPLLIGLVAAFAASVSFAACAQSAVATAAVSAELEADPWPRQAMLGDASVTIYAPQVESWDGNRHRFRAVVVLTAGAGQESVGVIWASAMARVDRVSRIVTLDDLSVSRATFPTLADGGAAAVKALRALFESTPPTVALDRVQASLAAGDVKSLGVPVRNVPPRVFVSDSAAVLVTISGEPVLRAVSGTSFERVINTRALILRANRGWYLRVYDNWMTADSIDGRWYPAERLPSGIDRIAQNFAAGGQADFDGGTTRSRRSLSNGAPTVYVSQTPAELIVFEGQPELQPIAGTALLWAANTSANVVVDIVSGTYYVLLAGRWFRSTSLNGPWTFVAARALPGDFAKIPPHEPAGAVLASVAGTPQAKEAVLESSMPQTATVPRTNGPAFSPAFDGYPQFRPITGTPLHYVANSPTPVIRVDPRSYLALQAGVWFEATSVIGPWRVAVSVPPAVYSIPVSSALHNLTYVRIYKATPQVVEVGYTPGYTGTFVTAEGVVVRGTGYAYPPWVGERYFAAPATYGSTPLDQRLATGQPFGLVVGAVTPSPARYGLVCSGGAYAGGSECCHPGATENVYGHWGNAVYTGSRSYPYPAPGKSGGNYRAAGVDDDHFADVNGSVYRYRATGWQKHTANGWERAAPAESAWATREQQSRLAGADHFKCFRERGGADRFARATQN